MEHRPIESRQNQQQKPWYQHKLVGIVATVASLVPVSLAAPSFAETVDENGPAAVTALANPSAKVVTDSKKDACASYLDNLINQRPSKDQRGCSTKASSPLSLDSWGSHIPTTNYKIPKKHVIFLSTHGSDANSGSKKKPMATLQAALDHSPKKGGTIVIRKGTYHQGGAGTDKTITIQPYPKEQVWFDGSVPVAQNKWRRDKNGRYFTTWNTPSFCGGKYYTQPLKSQRKDNKGPCAHVDMSLDPYNPMAVDPQMVFRKGRYIHEVDSYAKATGPNFYYDMKHRLIYTGFKPNDDVELAKYPNALVMGGNAPRVRGIGFKRYASSEWEGNLTLAALYIGAHNARVQNVVMKQMAAQALYISGRGGVVDHSVFANNGFDGITSNGSSERDHKADSLRLTNNVVRWNNTEHFGTNSYLSSAQAGVKIAHMNGAVAKYNVFDSNHGYGLWCDNNCTNVKMLDNTVTNNTRGGLLQEVSSKGTVASNLLARNGKNSIMISSADTVVKNNTVVDSKYSDEVWLYDDPRNTKHPGGVQVGPDTRRVRFTNNMISGYVTSMRMSGRSTDATNTHPTEFFAEFDNNAYRRKNGHGQPLLWYESPQKSLFVFDHKTISKLFAVAGQPLDKHGMDLGTRSPFANENKSDYRVVRGKANNGSKVISVKLARYIGISASRRSRSHRDVGAIRYPGSK